MVAAEPAGHARSIVPVPALSGGGCPHRSCRCLQKPARSVRPLPLRSHQNELLFHVSPEVGRGGEAAESGVGRRRDHAGRFGQHQRNRFAQPGLDAIGPGQVQYRGLPPGLRIRQFKSKDTRLKLLACWNPKKYGTKATVDVGNKDGETLKVEHDVGDVAVALAASLRSAKRIEAQ